MSHSGSKFSLEDAELAVNAEPFALPKLVKLVAFVLVLAGVVVFYLGVTAPGEAKRFWAAYQINMVYWIALSAASTGFAAVFQICNAQWSRPIRRIFEGATCFFMITPVFLLIPYVAGAYDHIFIWSHIPSPGKEGWLVPNFVYLRDIAALIILICTARKAIKFSMARDIVAVRAGLVKGGDRFKGKAYDQYTLGLTPSKASLQEIEDRFVFFSPVVIIIYALSMSLIAFDQFMSVDPSWVSTMFGAFIFMGGVYIAMAFASMMCAVCRSSHHVYRRYITRPVLHDLGKLLFGFGIFWTYLFWSQYLPIWYANMPEETYFLLVRLREQPWHDFAWVVLGGCFMIPFMLGISRDLKQVPILLFATGLIVAVAMSLQNYVIFVPTLFPTTIPYNWQEVVITLGFAGLYVLAFDRHMSKVPLIPFGDLLRK